MTASTTSDGRQRRRSTYTTAGDVTVGLKVTAGGDIDTDVQGHHVGTAPTADHHWSVGDSLTWAVGDALLGSRGPARPPGRTLAASKFTWTLAIEHCPSNCHEHIVQTRTGVKTARSMPPTTTTRRTSASTSRSPTAAGSARPCTATSSPRPAPSTRSRRRPAFPASAAAPARRRPGDGHRRLALTVTAPATVSIGEDVCTFSKWSDGGARNHAAKIDHGTNHLTATYNKTVRRRLEHVQRRDDGQPTGAWRTAG